jgi:hypothetical protein
MTYLIGDTENKTSKGFDLKVTQTAIGWFSWGLMRSSWNLDMSIFTEGGKPENPGKNPRSKGENQQTTLLTYDTESGNDERRALTPLRFP